jgi:hypothetical protein
VTNRQFSEEDRVFQKACELAGIPVTVRQAAKFRNHHGRAFQFKEQAIHNIDEEKHS